MEFSTIFSFCMGAFAGAGLLDLYRRYYPSSSNTKQSEPVNDRFEKLFLEECERNKELLARGRETKPYYSKIGGGYMTEKEMNRQVNNANDRKQLLSIFTCLEGMNYNKALKLVEKIGYKLHVNMVNNINHGVMGGDAMDTIRVGIIDPAKSTCRRNREKYQISEQATVQNIIDPWSKSEISVIELIHN